ncbi:MAG TPA: helix-turn-helix transcriptional regulator [Planctomycetaceae bacterium]
MADRKIERVVRDRRLTPDEAARYAALREQVRGEWPEIRSRIKDRLASSDPIRPIVAELKRARIEKGLSLAEVGRRTGMKSSTISKLESGEGATPTFRTLERYAEAIGKRIRLTLVDETAAAG